METNDENRERRAHLLNEVSAALAYLDDQVHDLQSLLNEEAQQEVLHNV
tara:strand:+ start:907 stop:1053 length:147 start_codon:yes stop_codon:yes gene_type:complete